MKRLLIFLMLGIFLLSFTSALDLDNVKSYDSINKEVTIKNAFGLGSDIGKAKLNTPLKFAVAPGYQKVAEFNILSYEDYNDILKSISLYDKTKTDWEKFPIEREMDIKVLSFKEILKDEYENVLIGKSKNGTDVYELKKIGVSKEILEEWVKVDLTNLKENENVTLGIFTNVKMGDYVEWIPKIYGVEIDEWAEWYSDLNNSLKGSYEMSGTSGAVIDSFELMNATANGVNISRGVTGKIGYGFRSLGGIDNYVGLDTENYMRCSSGNCAISYWMKTEPNTDGGTIIGKNNRYQDGDANGWLIGHDGVSTGEISGRVCDANTCVGLDGTVNISDGEYHHVVWNFGTSGQSLYIDGTLDVSSGSTAVSGLGGSGYTPVSFFNQYRTTHSAYFQPYTGYLEIKFILFRM